MTVWYHRHLSNERDRQHVVPAARWRLASRATRVGRVTRRPRHARRPRQCRTRCAATGTSAIIFWCSSLSAYAHTHTQTSAHTKRQQPRSVREFARRGNELNQSFKTKWVLHAVLCNFERILWDYFLNWGIKRKKDEIVYFHDLIMLWNNSEVQTIWPGFCGRVLNPLNPHVELDYFITHVGWRLSPGRRHASKFIINFRY